MKLLTTLVMCTALTGGLALAVTRNYNAPQTQPRLKPFVFERFSAKSPEAAAHALFTGIAMESPGHFVQHILLGVCDDSVDTLQKFAESLHETEFVGDKEALTFYELRKLRRGIDPEKPALIIATAHFDAKDPEVEALAAQAISTYYAEDFACVELEAESYAGKKYRTRIVAASVDGGWYAIPRCRSSTAFYQLADKIHVDAKIQLANDKPSSRAGL